MSREFSSADLEAVGAISVMPGLLDVVAAQTGMRFAAVARVTADRWVACAVKDGLGLGVAAGSELPIETTLCKEVRERVQTIAFDDALADPVYRDHHTPRIYGFRSYISVPILLDDGSHFGSLCALDTKPRDAQGPVPRAVVESLASMVGKLIDEELAHARTRRELRSERRVGGAREEFIAVVAHDLRNPLAAFQAAAELMSRDPEPKRSKLGARLRASAERMGKLIADLVDFSRGRSGAAMVVEREPHADFALPLEVVIDEARDARPDRDIRAFLDFPAPVVCDLPRVQQVVSNLLANALAYGDPASPVEVEGRLEGSEAVLRVSNRGEPIDPAEIEHIFEAFWRSSDGARDASMGLGLHICQQIAKAHGGRIDVASTDQDGTCFSFRWPSGT